jgi:hypothetical protein
MSERNLRAGRGSTPSKARAVPRGRRSRRNAVIVVGFAALLVVQGALSFLITPEPYPAIRMPSFGQALARDGIMPVTVTRVVISSGDQERTVAASDLMEPLRYSAAGPTLDYAFRGDPDRLSDDAKDWLRGRARAVSGLADPESIRLCWDQLLVNVEDLSIGREKPCEWIEVEL